MRENDIVADIFLRVETALREHLRNELGFEQSLVDQVCGQVRQQEPTVRREWKGARVGYVAERPRPDDETRQRALEEVNRTGNVNEAASKTGLSRSTLYRMLNRKR